MRLTLIAAAALAVAAPAFAQKPQDRPATQVSGPNVDVIKEAVNTLKVGGECMVEFTVGTDGKPKDMKPTCTPEEYVPFVLRAMETVEYLPEIFAGEVFDTEGLKQPFKFGAGAGAGGGVTQPVVKTNIDPKDINRAITRLKDPGMCNAEYVVGANGKPKDIQPNCTPDKYNKPISEAIAKMVYEPAQQGGKAIDFKMSMPMNLSNPD